MTVVHLVDDEWTVQLSGLGARTRRLRSRLAPGKTSRTAREVGSVCASIPRQFRPSTRNDCRRNTALHVMRYRATRPDGTRRRAARRGDQTARDAVRSDQRWPVRWATLEAGPCCVLLNRTEPSYLRSCHRSISTGNAMVLSISFPVHSMSCVYRVLAPCFLSVSPYNWPVGNPRRCQLCHLTCHPLNPQPGIDHSDETPG